MSGTRRSTGKTPKHHEFDTISYYYTSHAVTNLVQNLNHIFSFCKNHHGFQNSNLSQKLQDLVKPLFCVYSVYRMDIDCINARRVCSSCLCEEPVFPDRTTTITRVFFLNVFKSTFSWVHLNKLQYHGLENVSYSNSKTHVLYYIDPLHTP